MYIVERKLGKGGFGQVYVGRRAVATTAKDGPNANFVSILYCSPRTSLCCSCTCSTSQFFPALAIIMVLQLGETMSCSSLQTRAIRACCLRRAQDVSI